MTTLTEKKDISLKLSKLSLIFEDYSSKYKQLKMIKSFEQYVDSETVVLGDRLDTRLKNNVQEITVKKETFEFVSVRKTLESLLSSESIVKTIKEYKNECELEPLYYSFHPFWEKQNALRIVLFHDELEPKNVLSEISTLYEVDQFYFTILNLSRKHCSNLNNIFLVATIYSEDEKKYGINKVLDKIVEDIKILETTGIRVNGETWYGSIAQTAGDNLGKHQLFNIKQCFRGKNICDQCDASSESIQTKFHQDLFVRKTQVSYEQKLQEVQEDPSMFGEHGIHGPCSLNKLKYFHMTSNFAMDIMHDFYEGIVPFELSLILERFIFKEKYFDLKFLNDRILVFNYGSLDYSNKPGAITLGVNGKCKIKVKQKAVKMACLVRFLPFIIGDKIPKDNLHWKLFTCLSKILDYVNSVNLNLENTQELEKLVHKHHLLFKKNFPEVNLRKKHHNLVHYPSSIRELGNLIDYNGLRFEA